VNLQSLAAQGGPRDLLGFFVSALGLIYIAALLLAVVAGVR
jgi:uncharacterized membrane protein SpoIIM required for sporulation